jgi:acyl carrier protein
MTDSSHRERLLECFRAVFPDLEEGQLLSSSVETNPNWDSVAHVTLLSVIEEEFGSPVAEEQYGELTSFPRLLAYLQKSAV